MDILWSVGAVFVVLGMSALFFYCRHRFKRLASLGYLGAFLTGFIGSATVALPTPVFAVVAVVGSILNPFLVGLVTAIGSTIGDLMGYYIGYAGGGKGVDHNDYASVQTFMRNYGFLAIFVVAMTPAIDLAGIVAGYNNYPIGKFLMATFLGKLIKFLFYAYAGNRIAKYYKL